MKLPLSEHELTSLLNDFQNAQKERIKIKQQANTVFESQSTGVQSTKPLEELEDEHQKMYLSKINLTEKYQFARQLYYMVHNDDRIKQSGFPDVEETVKRLLSFNERPFNMWVSNAKFNDIGINEDAWKKSMQKLDRDLLDTAMSIRGMADVSIRSENDNFLTLWYWELKNGLIDALKCRPPCKLSSASDNLFYDIVAYDITYASGIVYDKNNTSKVLKFSTRHRGRCLLVSIIRKYPDAEPDSSYDIKFDHPLVLSTAKFREMIQTITTSGKSEKRDVHFISPEMGLSRFITGVLWNEMDWVALNKPDEMNIFPDHIYGGIPVFRPTWDQFKDFRAFVSAVRHYGYDSGIIKIIPPEEWKKSLPKDYSRQLSKVLIKNPCQQMVMRDTTVGYYVVRNIESDKTYTVKEWAELCETPKYATPPPKMKSTSSKSSQRRNNNYGKVPTNHSPKKRSTSGQSPPGTPPRAKKRAPEITQTPPETPPKICTSGSNKTITMISDLSLPEQASITDSFVDNDFSLQDYTDGSEVEEEVVLTSGQVTTEFLQQMPELQAAITHVLGPLSEPSMKLIKEEEPELTMDFEKLDYRSVNRRPYNDDEYIKELAAYYWKNVTYTPPYYGADMAGTLFTDATKSWNVNCLDNLLNTIDPIPGVNNAYLYFGMWKACFPWHVEDKDLYSINYIHFGAPKHWYAISPKRADKFEQHMRGWFGYASKNCSEFLRHKEFLASPSALDRAPILYNHVIQREGEFIITFPRGYHSGFNLGFNCAESVNFAFEDWIEIGIRAKSCACRPDSVRIDVRALFGHLLDPDLTNTKIKLPSDSIGATSTKIVLSPKKGRLKSHQSKAVHLHQCYLCPNKYSHDEETLEGGEFELIANDDGSQYAHGLCAMFVPETWIASTDGSMTGCKIIETEPIPSYRFETECQVCHTKEGACVQCQEAGCAKSFHVSCGDNDGNQFKGIDLEGQIYYVIYCKTHQKDHAAIMDILGMDDEEEVSDAEEFNTMDLDVTWSG
ncbi:12155_t:CDS:10 [Cetraspora pellucida]|uniref:[histone H3]-trimethyl-L-lysine(9) demethylase n=1 Tax=Cetraspora pellucida TaxID=1433469 RepID=A0A9N9HX61_9GLOM|nr:12155_t:CDS:10 [Cetraspora pellucida]